MEKSNYGLYSKYPCTILSIFGTVPMHTLIRLIHTLYTGKSNYLISIYTISLDYIIPHDSMP